MITRKANPSELSAAYLMGYEAWSRGDSKEVFLERCLPKYSDTQCYVLANGTELLSTLLLHQFGDKVFGLGSIATPVPLRRRGYAAQLITDVLAELSKQHSDATVFLYSDIGPKYYEQFGFTSLLPERQQKASSTSMVRPLTALALVENNTLPVPAYF